MKAVAVSATVAAVAAVAGCGTTATTPAGSTAAAASQTVAPSQSPAATASAEPVTAAAAKSAAETYFGLYAAGQYAAVYPMISPAARRIIRESVWTGLHERCRPTTATLTYKVAHPILAGTIAVVTVGYAGGAASLGSEQITFTYVDGKWYYQPSDLSVYARHNVAQAVAAAKAAGVC